MTTNAGINILFTFCVLLFGIRDLLFAVCYIFFCICYVQVAVCYLCILFSGDVALGPRVLHVFRNSSKIDHACNLLQLTDLSEFTDLSELTEHTELTGLTEFPELTELICDILDILPIRSHNCADLESYYRSLES